MTAVAPCSAAPIAAPTPFTTADSATPAAAAAAAVGEAPEIAGTDGGNSAAALARSTAP